MLIKSIIRIKNKIRISFDDDTFLILNENSIIEYNLYKGLNLPDELFDKLNNESRFLTASNYAFRLLSLRNYTKKELTDKLKKKEYEEPVILRVLNYLEEKNYINDEIFAEKFLESKIRQSKTGQLKIKSQLIKKGIELKIIERLFRTILKEEDFEITAINLAQKKIKMLKSKPLQEKVKMHKIYNFLLGKGFSMELSYKTAVSVVNKKEE
ncbi:MAG: regulatory protein RecX [Ignavibacteria bacterium]|nr:regulatory protein RecX [Ignavibacteria bacterium]